MKLSFDWLSDFVAFSEKDPKKIAEALTLSVAEVEKVEVQGELLNNCCVGRILSITKHPNADKLSLCVVETDRGEKRVVCGGTNLRDGMLVAFAHAGAKVKWHGGELMELTKTKIRGEESEGMICAASELDITEMFPGAGEREIIDLGNGKKDKGIRTKDITGTFLRTFLGLDDVIFHVDNHAITHRPDLFSHIGFARECAAIGLGKLKKKPRTPVLRFGKEKPPFKFILDAPRLMPRYCACFLEIDDVGETPDWMKKRLRAVGWRPLSLPVDITNYVATEIGVPLHSFDAADIHGTVHARTSRKGERIVTLDGKERILPDDALVLSDDDGIFDLLGIMGGLRSSTKSSTRRIYLHSASLNSASIRRTIIATGHRTDAATVYEKGVPNVTAEQGFLRAVQLFLELAPGARVTSPLQSYGNNGKPKPIMLSLSRASSLLGLEVKAKEATKILRSLDFDVKNPKVETPLAASLRVTPPLNRLGDIHGEVDLIEEIARIAGFASFMEAMPEAPIIPPKRDDRTNKMRDALKEAGFMELVQYAFLGEELLLNVFVKTPQAASLPLREIENPLGEDMKYLRPSLIPRILTYASENRVSPVRFFEIGHVFTTKEEHRSLAILSSSFLEAKQTLSEISASIFMPLTFDQHENPAPYMHPGRAAQILANESAIGSLFELHPALQKHFDLPERSAVAELNLDLFLNERPFEPIYKESFMFPSIVYDITIALGREIQVKTILDAAGHSHGFLRDIRMVDIFEKDGKRNCTFRCTYNAGNRTLSEEEVKPIHSEVEKMFRGTITQTCRQNSPCSHSSSSTPKQQD